MKVLALVLILAIGQTHGQFFRALANLFNPFRGLFNPRFRDDGTQSPQATGRDELFPSDCGRDPNKGTGKLCFPDGLLCQNRKFCYEIAIEFRQYVDILPYYQFSDFIVPHFKIG